MGSTTPPAPVRLAILEADTPLPNTHAKYHGYGGVFTDLFRRAVAPDPLDAHLAIQVHHVVVVPGDGTVSDADIDSRYPSLDDVDAVLISGSKHSAYLDEPWILRLVDFTRRALATTGDRRVRVVGVCFGHQIVGRALGVPVGVNDKGWEVSVTEIRLTGKGRELFGSDTLVSFFLPSFSCCLSTVSAVLCAPLCVSLCVFVCFSCRGEKGGTGGRLG